MKNYDETKQELIVKTWEQVINECKSVEEMLRQPIDEYIACYNPNVLSDEKREYLLKLYSERLEYLKSIGANYRFSSREQEILKTF